MRKLNFWRIFRLPLWIAGSILGLMLLVSVTAQIILSPRVSRRLIDRFAPELIDGRLEMSGASLSVFRHFPRITADIDSLVVLYPLERFDSVRRCGPQGIMVYAGKDTLASFRHFTASVNPFPLLRGVLRLNNVSLQRPRAYIHVYNDGSSNLDVLKFTFGKTDLDLSDTSAVTKSADLPKLEIKTISMGDRPVIVYTNQLDTLMASMLLKRLNFKGRLTTESFQRSSFDMRLDSLFIAGRKGRDTLIFRLDHLQADCRKGKIDIDASAVANTATSMFGRVEIPFSMNGNLALHTSLGGDISAKLRDMKMSVAALSLLAEMDVNWGDVIEVKGGLNIPGVELQYVIDNFGRKVVRELEKVKTDARLQASLDLDGYYDPATASLPAFKAKVSVPYSYLNYTEYDYIPKLELNVEAEAEQGGPISVDIEKCLVQAPGLDVNVRGNIQDLSGKDPKVELDATARMKIDSLGRVLTREFDLFAGGDLKASAKGKFNVSQLDLYSFSKADLVAKLDVTDLVLSSLNDSLNVYVDSLAVRTGLMDDRFNKKSASKKKSLGAVIKIDTLYLDYKDFAHISGGRISAFAQGSTSAVTLADTVKYNPVMARVQIGSIALQGQDSVRLSLNGSDNMASLHPSSLSDRIPVINIKSKNSFVRAAKGAHRVMLRQLDMDAKARYARERRKRRISTVMDSLSRVHPEWTADSIYRYLQANAHTNKVPDWLFDEEVKKNNIKIDLGETFRKYFSRWQMDGSISLLSARLATPFFPLRTRVTDFKGSFDNDRISLDTLRVVAGASEVAANGSISNLRRVLLGQGKVKVDFQVNTDTLSLSELMGAYSAGQKNMQSDLSFLDKASDEDVEKMVLGTDVDSAATAMLVIPSNLDADIRLRGRGVSYYGVDMKSLRADMLVSRSCLLLSDLKAITNAGDIYLDAFYSTRGKKKIYTGFDLTFKDISAGQVIALIPQIDQMMPIIKSFDGRFNCNIAATANMDTTMTIVRPSVKGVVRVTGGDLRFNENKQITRMARLLWMKNPKHVKIDSMKVEAIVRDNTLEIFPFAVKIDRWAIAAAGIQSLDESFNYHVSVAKSPFGLRLGANIKGDDFSQVKFNLGKARYRNVDQLPSFTTVIDSARTSLHGAILSVLEKGVDEVMQKHSNSHNRIVQERQAQEYTHSVALDTLEKVSAADQLLMKTLEADSLSVDAAIDSLSAQPFSEDLDAKRREQQEKGKGADAPHDVAVSYKIGDPASVLYFPDKCPALPPRRAADNFSLVVDNC